MSTYPREPTGRVETAPDARRLVIRRTFRAPIHDVWASLTEPDRFARWYGDMVGEAGPGKTVMVTMTAEREAVPQPARILECDPPNGFVVDFGDQGEPWHLSVKLAETDGVTTMTFAHTLGDDIDVTDVGPGWEFYADRLAASRDGDEMPDWDADGYLAALAPHYGAA
ncbi:MAG TPA: SRPBCC family protein [Acidimicrobiales bacterium]